jgi:hypothetical protein
MSMPYKILGRAMLMYSHCAYFGVTPQLGLVILLIWEAHFEPFPIVCALCAFQLRCWLIMTPRYLVDGDGVTIVEGSTRSDLALLLFLCAKSISASLECSRGELWVRDHL